MSETTPVTCAYSYTVKRGDSFYLIANKLGVPLSELLDANSTIHPARLMVGDVLCVPMCAVQTPALDTGDSPPETPEAPAVPTEPAEPAEPTVPIVPTVPTVPTQPETEPDDTGSGQSGSGTSPYVCPEGRTITVEEGQTASDLQVEYQLNYRTLERANEGIDLSNLEAGEQVCVPQGNFACAYPGTILLSGDDSLDSIAVRYNLAISALLRANPCLAPNQFVAGVTIRLP